MSLRTPFRVMPFRVTWWLAALVAVPFLVVLATAGPEKIAFPSDYRNHLRFATVDRAINDTVRVFYVSSVAAAQVRASDPLPSGTVITMEVHKARLDETGKPLRDAQGRFVRGDLVTIMVMEKRAGWGAAYPEDLRNGDWEYAQFNPDGSRHQPAETTSCLQCHRKVQGQDFVFSRPQLVGATR